MKINILTFDTLDSTNAEALKQARHGADEGLCIVARRQTAGRGRHGRTWVSEKDAGLYFSIVLRPKIEMKFLPLITLMTGVAVHDTLEEIGIDADIKWVNDLLVNDKKICGILAETTDTNVGLAVIVGIGINLKSSNFPTEIAGVATSIEHESSPPYKTGAPAGASPRGVDVGGVAAASADGVVLSSNLVEILTKYITYFYDILQNENGPAEIINEWRRRSTYFSGKPVRVVLENETITGVTDGLEANGALRVTKADGGVTIVQAGDVEQLRAE